MLGRNADRPRGSGGTLSILAAGMRIKGDITSEGDLHVDGEVDGDIACAALVQGAGSRITGTVRAKTARIAGAIEGVVEAETLTIDRAARITGDVAYTTLSIETGARVDGRMTHRGEGGDQPLRLVDASG